LRSGSILQQHEVAVTRLKRTLAGRPIPLFLCAVACLLLNWPILSIFGDPGGFPAIVYLFCIWLGIICGLAWYCHNETAIAEDHGVEESQ
jgi:hypothetical protein